MATFSAGECIAVGHHRAINRLRQIELPGALIIDPLTIHEGPFSHIEVATLYVEPGNEIFGIAKIAAALGETLGDQAVVDLNYYMDLSATTRKRPVEPFSEYAEAWLSFQERRIGDALKDIAPSKVGIGVIDSGVNRTRLARRRPLDLYDYLDGANGTKITPTLDPNGHGTRVVSILDTLLPSWVPISVGRVADTNEEVTVLSVSRAYADLVSRTRPIVANVSLHPSDDSPVGTILPFVFRMAEATTATVLAAGNNGDEYSGYSDVSPLKATVFAAAIGSHGRPTRYTNRPRGASATDATVWAFGGDDEATKDGHGFFAGRSDYGTSFAAPILSASFYAAFSKSGANTLQTFLKDNDSLAKAIRDFVPSWRTRYMVEGFGGFPL